VPLLPDCVDRAIKKNWGESLISPNFPDVAFYRLFDGWPMSASMQKIVEVNERPRLYMVAVIALFFSILFATISLWLLTIPLFFIFVALAAHHKAKYVVFFLNDQNKICKIFPNGQQECITLGCGGKVIVRKSRLPQMGCYYSLIVSSNSNLELLLLASRSQMQIKNIAEQISLLAGIIMVNDDQIID
jgi:hypothetical protein